MTALVPANPTPPAPADPLVDAFSRAEEYLRQAKADNTRRAYAADWRHFNHWCAERALASLPATPETVALYLSSFADKLKTSTLERRLNAISYAHRAAGLDRPTAHPGVREVLRGIKRAHGSQRTGKAPLLVEDLRQLLATLPEGLSGARDRAILLLGFASALRRSELVALDIADVHWVSDGVVLTVRRSKMDVEAKGEEVGVAYGRTSETCPVRALRAWLQASSVTTGPVFRAVDRHGRLRSSRLSPYAVTLILQRAAARADVQGAAANPFVFGAHSLRAGHATAAARAGAPERAIMRQGRWKSERTVRSYIRHGTLFAENTSSILGL